MYLVYLIFIITCCTDSPDSHQSGRREVIASLSAAPGQLARVQTEMSCCFSPPLIVTILTAGTLATLGLGLGGGEVGGGAPGQLAGVQAELGCVAPLMAVMTIVTLGAVLCVGGVEVGGGVGLSLVVRVLVLVVRVPEPPAPYWWLTKISNKLATRS